jgi:hypothetical protein
MEASSDAARDRLVETFRQVLNAEDADDRLPFSLGDAVRAALNDGEHKSNVKAALAVHLDDWSGDDPVVVEEVMSRLAWGEYDPMMPSRPHNHKHDHG